MRIGHLVLGVAILLTAAAIPAFAQGFGSPAPPDEAAPPDAAPAPREGPPRGRPSDRERPRSEGRRPGPGSRIPHIFRDVTEEQIKDILDFMGEYMPWRRETLEQMQTADPERFRQLCRRLRFEVAQLRSLKQRDEKAFHMAIEERQLKMRAGDIAEKVRKAEKPDEKQALTKELRRILDRLFEVEMVTHEAHIGALDERIDSLRKELRDRAKHRREIVDQRLKETLEGKPDTPFPFGPPPGFRRPGPKDDSRRGKPPPDETPPQTPKEQ